MSVDVSVENNVLENQFSVFAVRKSNSKALIQTHLSFGRLIDDIVVPFDTDEMFFIDGVPLKSIDLDQIKIIKVREYFFKQFNELHRGIRWGDLQKQKLYADQYNIRLEALLREYGEDVTSQIIKAYKTAIKPKLKDYLPNRETLLNAAISIFTESIKVL